MIIVSCYSQDSHQALELVSDVGNIIIARHDEKYEIVRLSFELLIKNIDRKTLTIQNIIKSIEGQIKAIQSQIKAITNKIAKQTQYSNEVLKDISKGDGILEEFRKQLSEIKPDQASPVEILFLQTSYSNEQINITTLRNTHTESEIEIDERKIEIQTKKMEIEEKRKVIEGNKNSIADLKDQSIDLKLKLNLSTRTQIIKPANLPESPISPNKKLFLIVGSFIGFIFSISYILLQEILKS